MWNIVWEYSLDGLFMMAVVSFVLAFWVGGHKLYHAIKRELCSDYRREFDLYYRRRNRAEREELERSAFVDWTEAQRSLYLFVLDGGDPDTPSGDEALDELDGWSF